MDPHPRLTVPAPLQLADTLGRVMATIPTPNPAPAPEAVVLLSGGLDSATCLAIAQDEGFHCHALAFAYGQRHAVELDAARRIAERSGVELTVAPLDLRAIGGSAPPAALGAIGGSALTADIDVPKATGPNAETAPDDGSPTDRRPGDGDIPVTYVPARN